MKRSIANSRAVALVFSAALAVLPCSVAAQGTSSGPDSAELLRQLLKKTENSRGINAQTEDKLLQSLMKKLESQRGLTRPERYQLGRITKRRPSADLTIYFDYKSTKISKDAEPVMKTVARTLNDSRLAGSRFLIAGHTDAKGSDQYNRLLSKQRAEAVRKFLIEQHNIPESRLKAVGYGEEQLKKPSAPMDGANRRVQIVNVSP